MDEEGTKLASRQQYQNKKEHMGKKVEGLNIEQIGK